MGKFAVAAACLGLVACSSAKKASEVPAIYTSPAPYMAMECGQLLREADNLRVREAALTGQVDTAYSNEKTKEVVAWLLFAPAALLYEDNAEIRGELGQVRGQKQAISSAVTAKNCYNANNLQGSQTASAPVLRGSGDVMNPVTLAEARTNALNINVTDLKFSNMNALGLCAFDEIRENNDVKAEIVRRGLKCEDVRRIASQG